MSGIFIAKGVTFSIQDISISLGPRGSQHTKMKVKLGFDVCPLWLEIALEHLLEAKIFREAREKVWKTKDDNAKGESLENEFKASMQAMVAAAVAVDAFYSAVRSKVEIDNALVQSWRQKKTSRYAQASETFKIAFQLKLPRAQAFRKDLRQVYGFRDQAVHPSAKLNEAILHPETNIGVEWRFVAFRYENALPHVHAVIEMISEMAARSAPLNEEVRKYAEYLRPRFDAFRAIDIFQTGGSALQT